MCLDCRALSAMSYQALEFSRHIEGAGPNSEEFARRLRELASEAINRIVEVAGVHTDHLPLPHLRDVMGMGNKLANGWPEPNCIAVHVKGGTRQ